MANNLTAVISADTSKFIGEIKNAQKVLNDWNEQTKGATNQVKENQAATERQATAYAKALQSIQAATDGTRSAQSEHKALGASLTELKLQYVSLSDAVKSSDFGKSMQGVIESVQNEFLTLGNNLRRTKEDIKALGVSNNLHGLTEGIKGVSEAGKKEIPLKKQLRAVQTELTLLTQKYRYLSDEERNSDFGKNLAKQMDSLREKGGELRDVIFDVSDEIKVLSTDTPNFDVFNETLSISADGLTSLSGIISKVTGDEQALTNILSTFATVQGAANFSTKVANAMQSSSVLMLKIRSIQEGAAATAISIKTAAEGKGVITTKAAAAAQRAFNIVAKANPYLLLATIILGAIAALWGLTKGLEKLGAAQNQAKKSADELKKKQEQQRAETQELNKASADASTEFFKLRAQWSLLKTTAEKTQFIKDNATAFSNLGLSVNSVTDAESIFVKNTDAVLDAILQRAVAAKKADQIAEQLSKLNSNKTVASGDYRVKYEDDLAGLVDDKLYANGLTGRQILKQSGVTADEFYRDKNTGKIHYNGDSAKNKIKAFSEREAAQKKAGKNQERKELEDSYKEQISIVRSANHTISGFTEAPKQNNLYSGGGNKNTPNKGGANHNTNTTEDPKLLEGSLAYLQKQKAELEKNIELDVSPKEDDIKELQRIISEIEKKELELKVKPNEGSLAYFDERIKDTQDKINNASTDEARNALQKQLEIYETSKKEIEVKLKPIISTEDLQDLSKDIAKAVEEEQSTFELSPKTKRGKAEKATSKAEKIQDKVNAYQNILDSNTSKYSGIKERVSIGATISEDEKNFVSMYENATKAVNVLKDAYKDATKEAENLNFAALSQEKIGDFVKESVSAIGSLNSSISNIVTTWGNMSETLQDKSGFEQITTIVGATVDTINSGIAAFEAISNAIQLFADIAEIAAAKKKASNAQEITSNTALATSNITAAGTEAVKGGAKLGFPLMLVAIPAALGVVAAALSMLPKFANGGIVEGNSSIGDFNLARVNSGEMILNHGQQGRLFRLLNGDSSTQQSSTDGQVKFRISGADLVGVLDNYNTKRRRL